MNRSYVYGGLVVLVIAAIVGAWMFFQLPEPDAPMERADTPAGQVADEPGNAPAGEAATAQALVPSFDIVRVDEAGNVVIAGRAVPGCTIVVREGDVEVGRVTADRSGEWVLVPAEPLAAGERELRLFAECEGADPVEADRVIALSVPERSGESGRPTQSVAVAVARDGSGEAEVLQRPNLQIEGGPAAIGGIDYDDNGNTTISGIAAPNSTVRLYLDNRLVGETRADSGGQWSITLNEKVTPGSYNLRVDQVGPDGRVFARSEISFVRGEPLTDLPEGRIVIIQPGDHLWKLARQRYGSGFQYTLIYDANKEQIRNPDLIYPGQIFTLPTVN